MRKVLNVGGNDKAIAIPAYYAGWQHDLLDIDPGGKPEIVCDAREIATRLPARSYDAVYCSHNLEHYFRHDARRVLQGFGHVLKDDGFVEIVVPDILHVIRHMAEHGLDIDDPLYTSQVGVIHCSDVIYGYAAEIESSGSDFFAHKTGYSQQSLSALLGSFFPISVVLVNNQKLELRALAFKSEPSAGLLAMLGVPAG